MTGFEKQTYTQVPNSLFEIMGDMDECELKVVLYICRYTFGYHREGVTVSTRKMARAIGMSVASVAKGAEAAEKRGLIERVNDGQNSTEWRAIVNQGDSNSESPNAKVIQKMNQGDSNSESQVGLNKDKESIKQNGAFAPNFDMPLDWQIATGQEKLKKPDNWESERNLALMNLYKFGADLQSLAEAFIDTRHILPKGKSAYKTWGTALRHMRQNGVTAEHVRMATGKLTKAGMTVSDPYSISRTAIDMANKTPTYQTPAVY